MDYLMIKIGSCEMTTESIFLLISLFVLIIMMLIFYILAKDKINYIKKECIPDNEDFDDRFKDLDYTQINFYFDLGQKQLEDIFKLRDDENKTILNHVAIIIAVFSLFYILAKWSYCHHNDLSYFLPLTLYLSFAIVNMTISIWSIFQALRLPYKLPAQIHDIEPEDINSDVNKLKEMFIERFAGDAKNNKKSNERKMLLLDHSRFFLWNGLCYLGFAFLFICVKKYLSFILL